MVSKRIRVTAGVAAAAAVVAAAASAAEAPVVRYTAADQARAKTLVLKAADLGVGWKGGATKADPTATSPCADWSPKQADLVVTGAAQSQFAHADGRAITSLSMVYRTPRMATLDWQRTVVHSEAMRCLRRSVANVPDVELLSFARTAFPKVARYATRFRVVLEVAAPGGGKRVLMDFVVFGRDRQLLSFVLVAPYGARAAADAAERRLARLLVARIPG